MISNASSGGASLTTVNIYQSLELEPAQDTAQATVVPGHKMLYKELRRHKNFASFPYLSTALGARPEVLLGLVGMNFPGIMLKVLYNKNAMRTHIQYLFRFLHSNN